MRAQETVLGHNRMPYREWLTATEPDDPVWRRMRLHQALDRVEVPVLLQEGWQDRFVDQMLDQDEHLRSRGVEVGLTIGPWTHVEMATKAAGSCLEETLDWLGEHVAGSGRRARPGPVRGSVGGAEEWRDLPEWPPPSRARVLHLQTGGGLGDTEPEPTTEPSAFVYDPADPAPAIGGRIVNPMMGGYRDNRKLGAAGRRPDLHHRATRRTAGGGLDAGGRAGARLRQPLRRPLRQPVRGAGGRPLGQPVRRVPATLAHGRLARDRAGAVPRPPAVCRRLWIRSCGGQRA